MSIIGRKVVTFIATHSLEAHPDIGLGVFQNMTEMQRRIGVGKGVSD
jgi:hypothetical protein